MPRPTKRLTNMEIDEISLVDKGANQHAMITIAKRAPEEETMPELYNEEGQLLDENSLEHGQVVYDNEGAAYEFILEDEEVEDKELAEVGKSAFFDAHAAKKETFGKSFAEQVMEELSKADSDKGRDEVLSKAFSRIEEIEKRYEKAEEIAKAERDLRLTREYVSKAADYNVPVAADELGPVLYRMAETMSYDDCAVIAKCLEASGELIYDEIGYIGGGDNADIMSQVEARAVEIGKSADPAVISTVFDQNPEAYDQYLADRRGRY